MEYIWYKYINPSMPRVCEKLESKKTVQSLDPTCPELKLAALRHPTQPSTWPN